MPGDDRDLVSRAAAGEPGARDEFVDRFVSLVHGIVIRVTGRRVDADVAVDREDIVQDIFVRLFGDDARLLKGYDPARAAPATWLALVARSTALDIIRKRRLATLPLSDSSDRPADEEARMSVDEPEAIDREILPPRQRLVLGLLYDREMDVHEVAETLGIAEQTVRSARHKALKTLREKYRDKTSDDAGMSADPDRITNRRNP